MKKYLYISLIIPILLKIINNKYYIVYNMLLNYIAITVILLSSTYFIIKLKYINYNYKKIIKEIKKTKKEDKKALFMSLGSKIGVGSIAGISIAVYINGPGVLLWIWIIASISSILTYTEVYLGCKYKNGVYSYIKNENLKKVYIYLLILIYIVGFIGIQTNTIYKSLIELDIISKKNILIIIILIISTLVFNKIEKIISITSKIVPIMCLTYIIISIPILFKINIIKAIRIIIYEGINNNKIISIITIGLLRGIFATESGIGTASITTTISKSNKEKQAITQLAGVHFIRLVIITITGLIVTHYRDNYIGRINGIEIIVNIFNNIYGYSGKVIINIIIFLFAISTILSSYFFIIKGIENLNNSKRINYNIIRLIIIIFSLSGMIIKSSVIWSIIDNLIIYTLIINIYAMIKLRKEIK